MDPFPPPPRHGTGSWQRLTHDGRIHTTETRRGLCRFQKVPEKNVLIVQMKLQCITHIAVYTGRSTKESEVFFGRSRTRMSPTHCEVAPQPSSFRAILLIQVHTGTMAARGITTDPVQQFQAQQGTEPRGSLDREVEELSPCVTGAGAQVPNCPGRQGAHSDTLHRTRSRLDPDLGRLAGQSEGRRKASCSLRGSYGRGTPAQTTPLDSGVPAGREPWKALAK